MLSSLVDLGISCFLQVTVPCGALIAGFGKGHWEKAPEASEIMDPGKKIPFELTDHKDMIVFDGQYKSLLDVINNRRTRDPAVKVSYHDMNPQASGPPGAFDLAKIHSIVFCPGSYNVAAPEEEDTEAAKPPASLQASAASSLPANVWQQKDLVGIKYSMKWSATSLAPIRPQVVATSQFCVPPGRAALL